MDIYLPIAGQSVNALFMIALGFLVGVLSGMFGVGGGFLTTPLLIFYGIPPTGRRRLGRDPDHRRQRVGRDGPHAPRRSRPQNGRGDDRRRPVRLGRRRGAVFRLLQSTGQIDVVIGLLYVLILAGSAG